MGNWLTFCSPPAMTRSAVPAITACAANVTACWLDPHCRSTVTPGTCSGRPATSATVRANIAGLGADRVDAAVDDILDRRWVDIGALHHRPDRMGAQVRRMDPLDATNNN